MGEKGPTPIIIDAQKSLSDANLYIQVDNLLQLILSTDANAFDRDSLHYALLLALKYIDKSIDFTSNI